VASVVGPTPSSTWRRSAALLAGIHLGYGMASLVSRVGGTTRRFADNAHFVNPPTLRTPRRVRSLPGATRPGKGVREALWAGGDEAVHRGRGPQLIRADEVRSAVVRTGVELVRLRLRARQGWPIASTTARNRWSCAGRATSPSTTSASSTSPRTTSSSLWLPAEEAQ